MMSPWVARTAFAAGLLLAAAPALASAGPTTVVGLWTGYSYSKAGLAGADANGDIAPGFVPFDQFGAPFLVSGNAGHVVCDSGCNGGGGAASPFVPNNSYTPVTASTSSGSTAVAITSPGTSLVIFNTGAVPLAYNLGGAGVTAALGNMQLGVGCWSGLGVSAGTADIALLTASGTGSAVIAGGSGLPTSGCSTSSVPNASVGAIGGGLPGSVTYLGASLGGALTGLTMTANGLKVDPGTVTVSNFPATQPVSGSITANIDSTDAGAIQAAAANAGTVTDGAYSGSGSGTLNAILKAINAKLAGTLTTSATLTDAASATNGTSTTWCAQGGTGNALLTATIVFPFTGAHSVYNWYFLNTNTAFVYAQTFDLASGGTLGTTVPRRPLPIPPNGGVWSENLGNEGKLSFLNGLAVAVTTTPNGSTAPASGIFACIDFK